MGKRGPKPWEPTEKEQAQIKLYAGLGMKQDDCAQLVGRASSTFRANELAKSAFDAGKAETIAKVAGSLVKKALAGDTTSAIFYLKTQAGWKETVRSEHTGKDGGPIEVESRESAVTGIASALRANKTQQGGTLQ